MLALRPLHPLSSSFGEQRKSKQWLQTGRGNCSGKLTKQEAVHNFQRSTPLRLAKPINSKRLLREPFSEILGGEDVEQDSSGRSLVVG